MIKLKKSLILRLALNVFCFAFFLNQIGPLVGLVRDFRNELGHDHQLDPSPFPIRTQAIQQMLQGKNLSSVFLSPKIKNDALLYQRTLYALWPTRIEEGAAQGFRLKDEQHSGAYETIESLNEVNFVRRKP